jgi:starch synthase
MPSPVHLALVWHMHQPYYKDDLTSTYLLPWVRLHCVKDYHKMAALLDGYPRLRQTFNLVPSLLAQIDDYGRGEAHDLFLNLCRRPATELSAEERSFLVRWVRESPQALRVQQSPRYLELASREGGAESFTNNEIRDLQVWSNLAWFDPVLVDRDARLSALKAKDVNFSEEDKEVLFAAQLEMVRSVIPKYREMAQQGRIELTTSPYYHPILPLVVDVASAREASPGIELPDRPFAHPDDAEQQIALGLSTFERLLGMRPRGMWPSEMAVADSVVRLAGQAGIDWLISDEDVLARSLEIGITRDGDGRVSPPQALYKPHRIERDGREVTVVFRDKVLSNLIGFEYYRMPAQTAARDFMARLRRIREMQGDDEFLVVVALDGENAWEFYPRDGHDFLNALYTELDASSDVISTTVEDYLARHEPGIPLTRLHAGSWINASFDTWIGDPEHTVAWDLLAQTRDWLDGYAREHPHRHAQLASAWREIMITEGSDWYWWFSRRHDSGMDVIWDNQFRLHLRNVYKLLEAKPPSRLFDPIVQKDGAVNVVRPIAEFTPTGPDDPAWRLAGRFEVSTGFGALHRPGGLAERVFYGCDEQALHLKVESSRPLRELGETGVSFWIYLSGPALTDQERSQPTQRLPMPRVSAGDLGFEPAYAASVRFDPGSSWISVHRIGDWRTVGEPLFETEVPQRSALAFSIPFSVLEKGGGEPLELAMAVIRRDAELERIPPTGSLGLQVPGRARLVAGSGEQLKILLASAEVTPFAKTGGLADVAAALPKELRRLGHDVRIVMPRYRQISREYYELRPVVTGLDVPLGSQTVACNILEGRLGEVPVYFVDCPSLFDRDGIYGFGDDDARFIYFNRALLEMLGPLGFVPDVIHLNDWHTALVPNLLEMLYVPARPELSGIATVLTIHNLAFQGAFGFGSLHLAGLEHWGLLKVGVPHLDDIVNILGRGIHFADIVNTVSERYAEEIQTPDFGEGMDALLARHSHKLHGVVNGIDVEMFDPVRDPAVHHHYSADDPSGKRLNRDALRRVLGLEPSPAPVVALISRLYDQKGLDIIEQALPAIIDHGVQIAVLGTGERRYEDMFRQQAAQHAGRVSASIGFDHHLAQLLYAGSDMVLMASRFEPCGLGQLIGMRYGAIPVVRATGGLVDTVRDYDPAVDGGWGFVFEKYDAWALFGAVVRAAEVHRHRDLWERLVRRAMAQDVSWAQSARRYVELYRTALVSNRDRRGVMPSGLLEPITTAR